MLYDYPATQARMRGWIFCVGVIASPSIYSRGASIRLFRILKDSFLYFPEIFKIFVNSFVNKKKLLNLERVGGDLRLVKLKIGIIPTLKIMGIVKITKIIIPFIFFYGLKR